ncbi:MAG: hypothetical protein JGK24_26665 [Microcoleus sp. PH2017_29_MFU_D_A]|uniref:hypothetical protein n=1 Tax=unclassified Microcoleus TaxID=2642155 RepID=UPI001D6D250F|nr:MULTISPECIES: hypothetical protein [unclassified Microcoleus]MCC3418842.1 hypothetical protein [Microcoleus sp. PH2017_07_MST_O_A]MCC3470008.1 hypothetical protein [Microcoleus sp. PH2017_06_SFM_O_A]MCC3512001.1 hypothetical protein [Microcoleus sp. PH2017_17_BER_D_A]TAG71218.1 MAG: hypothetical protein EAZ23_19215 [Oscillatoriales cyanobacterium]MCC3427714.1 hypothetical protein [Microcoleus sp. PH2017_01_SCD_O_A]
MNQIFGLKTRFLARANAIANSIIYVMLSRGGFVDRENPLLGEAHSVNRNPNQRRFYRKASGKPPTLGVGMNAVVTLATLKKLVAKKFYLKYFMIK